MPSCVQYTVHTPALPRPACLLQGAWTHLVKEACVSLTFMDGALLRPAVADRLGLQLDASGVPRSHLLLGTATGDCIFVECEG